MKLGAENQHLGSRRSRKLATMYQKLQGQHVIQKSWETEGFKCPTCTYKEFQMISYILTFDDDDDDEGIEWSLGINLLKADFHYDGKKSPTCFAQLNFSKQDLRLCLHVLK